MLDFKLKFRLSDSTRCRRWQILSLERRKKILEFFQEEHFDSGKAQHPQIASERNSSRKQLLQRRVSARIPSVTDAIRRRLRSDSARTVGTFWRKTPLK